MLERLLTFVFGAFGFVLAPVSHAFVMSQFLSISADAPVTDELGLQALLVVSLGWIVGPLLLWIIVRPYNDFVLGFGLLGTLVSCGFGPTNPFGSGYGPFMFGF